MRRISITLAILLNCSHAFAQDKLIFAIDLIRYVKVMFNGKPVNIPGCNDSNVCSLKQFAALSAV